MLARATTRVLAKLPANGRARIQLRRKYEDVYARSLSDPVSFWDDAAKGIDWFKKYDKVLDSSCAPLYRWYSGGVTNMCHNALDRHLATRPNQTALIYESTMTNRQQKWTYTELTQQVELFAGALSAQGLKKGETVIIYMPMIPQAVIAMLACARLGAIHSVVFGGFAADQLTFRINHAKPKFVITASCGLEPGRVIPYKPLVDKAISNSVHKPQACIVYQRDGFEEASMQQGRDLDWDVLMMKSYPHPCVPVAATDPLYLLYTSGTTGDPKGIVRDTGGYMVALKWSMQNIYDSHPGDVYWTVSDIGWVVGHSYIVYGPLLNGNTSILYEGKPVTPDPGVFWRIISEHKVKTFFTSPTAFRGLKREDPDGNYVKKYDLSSLKSLWLAGERADPDTVVWAEKILPNAIPVLDHYWQTETGWPVAANLLGLGKFPTKYGSCTHAVPGYDIQVVDDDGKLLERGKLGNLVIKLPLPPGAFTTLHLDDAKCKRVYFERFPGFYNTGDAGIIDKEGYLHVLSRTDDVINVSGIRLSTGAVEEVLASHQDVAECCVVGPRDNLKGQLPVALLVLKSHTKKSPEEVVDEVIKMVREKIGPIASFRSAAVVDHLPKTRSGKVLRSTLKKIADGDLFVVPATIENPATLDTAKAALQSMGYPAPQ